jgi:uncharacterized protein YxeA
MKIIIICIIVVAVLFLYSALNLSKQEDKLSEIQYLQYIKSKNKENNKTNNEGE